MMSWLKEPQLQGQTPGTARFFALQKAIIHQRPLLKWCYDGWYARLLADARSVAAPGLLVELGSGGSYLKDLEPALITSDVVAGVADQVIDARQLPFADGSVKALFLTHVFHHIPDVRAFFAEAQRVLVPGGVISMIEVAHTPFARFFFKNFHHEPYRDEYREWSFAQTDSMMDSNQALSWMVFDRDRARFEQQYPGLKVETPAFLPWLAYLLSGGVTMRHLVPGFMNGPIRGMEHLLSPLASACALHWHLCVRKTAASPLSAPQLPR
jgi:SAM-dependent methyltransferase